MKPVLSHITALEYWRAARTTERSYRSVASVKPLLEKSPGSKSIKTSDFGGLSRPLHVLVDSDRTRRSSKDVISHVRKGALPSGAVIDSKKGFYVCSPELCFVQMAHLLDLPQVIELGYEFCGTYDVSSGEIIQCDPLTSVKKLNSFALRAKGMAGRKKALRALRYVTEFSASPKETVLTMLLCLPYLLGGYGLTMPVLNYRIDMNKEARVIVGKNYCMCDLYWPDSKLAVEYDSDEFHTGPERIAQDSARRTALAAMDVSVITVTNKQLSSSGLFNKLAHVIAAHTGKYLQYRDPEFTRACLHLRKSLHL